MNVMATNKQTMDVIAMGLVPGNAKAEEREDVICPVIEQIAQRAAEDFTDMAIELDMQGTLEMDWFIIENIMMSGHADSDTSENGGGHEM